MKVLSMVGFVLAMISTVVSTGAAQSKTPYGQSDPRAKTLLDAVSKKFQSYQSVKADFILKVEGANNKVNDSKRGTIFLKGNKYKLNLSGQEIYCDGKTTWTYQKDVNEVQVNKYEPDNSTISPSRLFTNFYDKEFLYRLDGESNEKGKLMQNVELTPLDKSKPFFKVVVSIDKKTHMIMRTKVFEKNGNRFTYEVSRLMPNVAMNDAIFAFDTKDHPNVEVVDLR